MAAKARRTTDHRKIRRWAEERKGRPSVVKGTEILRFDFGKPEESLEAVEWEEFFRIFDDRGVEFLYQEETAEGEQSRFFKFVSGEDSRSENAEGERPSA